MPNIDSPPDPSGVDPFVSESVIKGNGHFLVDFIKSGPAGHEFQYMKRRFNYKDFEFAAYYAFDKEWRRDRFLLMNFSQARKRAAISIGARLAIGLSILVPFLL